MARNGDMEFFIYTMYTNYMVAAILDLCKFFKLVHGWEVVNVQFLYIYGLRVETTSKKHVLYYFLIRISVAGSKYALFGHFLH
jgi:hypothetical protein